MKKNKLIGILLLTLPTLLLIFVLSAFAITSFIISSIAGATEDTGSSSQSYTNY